MQMWCGDELDQSFLMPDVRVLAGDSCPVSLRRRRSTGCPDLKRGSVGSSRRFGRTAGSRRDDFLRPFNAFFKATRAQQIGGTGDEPDNQLASVFARWVFPRAGVEIYGEYGREDYNADLPDLIGEPDHDASYMLGMQRVWKRANAQLFAIRGEVLNTRMTSLNIVRAADAVL